jgi:thioredoxin 1
LSDPELTRILNEKAKRMSSGISLNNDDSGTSIVRLTTSNFDRQINSGKPVFVDFWAVWCGPCRTMEPIVEKLAARYTGKAIFGKLNIDEESKIATKYEVQSIPTFMIFRNGKPVDAAIGAVGEAALDRLIQKSMGAASVYR